MKKLTLLLMLLTMGIAGTTQDKTYYVSPDGNDANSGLSADAPWQTIAKVNSINFKEGDSILFEGGRVFAGSIFLWSDDKGIASNPIVLSSYGTGRAQINAGGAGNGLMAYNTGGIVIEKLIFFSNGATTNKHNGVEFYTDTTVDIDYVIIDEVETYGFGTRGISIGAWFNEKGFTNVKITNSVAHDNGETGIETYGHWPRYSHRNVYVGYCKAYNNFGRRDRTDKHSGSGIILSGIDGATIEYCEAYANGKDNGHYGGGPVGIWFYDVKNGVIQYSESHHNQAGLDADGGGFDIDGGSQNCIIQYCYSHDNDGSGYGLYEYGSPNAFVNNVIRYNISQNDGRKNYDAGIALWGVSAAYKVTNSQVYNNTIYVNNTGVVNGVPSAIKVVGTSMSGVTIRNNIFHVSGGARMLRATDAFSASAIIFQNNNYYSEESTTEFLWSGTPYTSLTAWKAAASGQEMHGTASLGTTSNPYFVNPGKGGRVGPAEGGDLTNMLAYQLQAGSPMIDAGLNLKASFGVNTGPRDFYNNTVATGASYDIGAHEISLITLPLDVVNFNAVLQGDFLQLAWAITGDESIETFVVEKSVDGRSFEDWTTHKVASGSMEKNFAMQLAGPFPVSFYCRIKAVTDKGKVSYSKVVPVNTLVKSHPIQVYPNPVISQVTISTPSAADYKQVVLWSSEGKRMMQKRISDAGQPLLLEMQHLKPGVYYLELLDEYGKKEVSPIVKK